MRAPRSIALLALLALAAWHCQGQGQQGPEPVIGPGSPADAGASADAGPGPDGGPSPDGGVGAGGGTVALLDFAIVGDTRPAMPDDVAGYPSAIIEPIWRAVEASQPHPAFAIATGDFQFGSPGRGTVQPQLDLYMKARAAYRGVVFPVMGNHECTGATASNCGPGNLNGETENYRAYLATLMAPIAAADASGPIAPYYVRRIDAADGRWTAKFVFIAANAWSEAQAGWLDAELARPTTYTFVVRHEGNFASGLDAPGVPPSQAIMARHAYTILIAGHTHTLSWSPRERMLIVGNGGAPPTGSVGYGYVTALQRGDGAIVFSAHDYATGGVLKTFAVDAAGAQVP